MPRNFARHEQFLRIFTLLEVLSTTREPLDDEALIATLKSRLGIGRLSGRTLHRDCAFLASCGYPVEHGPLPEGRRYGWRIDRAALGDRDFPAEPVTILELVAFMVGRDLLRSYEGTVLWTGIESLRGKIERAIPPALLERLDAARNVFHVANGCPSRYAARPRLISALSTAIADTQEIEVAVRGPDGVAASHRLRPLRLVIEPPRVVLLAAGAQETAAAVLVDLERIERVNQLDATFVMPLVDAAHLLATAVPLS